MQSTQGAVKNLLLCAGQEADACPAESLAVWILSLKLQLPEPGNV